MPSGLIEQNHRMSAVINHRADFGKVCLHGGRVAIRHDETGSFALRRTDGAENVSPFRALIVRRTRTSSAPCPSACDFVLLSDPGFVLEPDFYFRFRREPLSDRRQLVGEVFLNSSIASVSCA
jgi:hypothetical protein